MRKHKSCASSSEVNVIWIVLSAVAKENVQISPNISQIKAREVSQPIRMAQIIHFSSVSKLPSCMSWSIWVRISPCSFSLFSGSCQIVLSCWHHLLLQCPANLEKPFPALPSWLWWVRVGVSIGISCSLICSLALGQCHSELSSFRTTLLRFNRSLRSTNDGRWGHRGLTRCHLYPVQGLCLPCQSTQRKPGETTSASLGPANTRGR